jgi:hypothetical protein
LFIPQIGQIEAKRSLFIPQIRKNEAKQTRLIPEIGKIEAKKTNWIEVKRTEAVFLKLLWGMNFQNFMDHEFMKFHGHEPRRQESIPRN